MICVKTTLYHLVSGTDIKAFRHISYHGIIMSQSNFVFDNSAHYYGMYLLHLNPALCHEL